MLPLSGASRRGEDLAPGRREMRRTPRRDDAAVRSDDRGGVADVCRNAEHTAAQPLAEHVGETPLHMPNRG